MKGVILGLLLFTFSLQAQVFTTYTFDNSDLPSNIVNRVIQDGAGNTWIGTENGLLLIDDENNWTVFDTDNSAIPGNTIRSLWEDTDGSLWVGTQLSGMGHFDGTTWANYDPLNSGLPEYHVRAFNKSSDGTYWIGTPAGLVRWDGADDWFTYPMSEDGFIYVNITSIYINEFDELFMGTINGGLATLIDDEVTHYRTDNSLIGDNTIADIVPDEEGNLWMATAFGGLCVLTPDFDFLNFNIFNSDISDLSVNAIDYKNGDGFLAMDAFGLNGFNGTYWTIWNEENSDLPTDLLNDVWIDENGLIYIATDGSGLTIFDRNAVEVDSEELFQINIYPNPASDVLLLTNIEGTGTCRIINTQGQVVLEQSIESPSSFIDVRHLSKGIYFAELIVQNSRQQSQLIIQ